MTESLKELRQRAGLTQDECMELIGAPKTPNRYRTWQNWEAGTSTIPPYALELFLLKAGLHPIMGIVSKGKIKRPRTKTINPPAQEPSPN